MQKIKFHSDPRTLKMQPAGLVQKMSKMWIFYTDFTQRFCTDSEFFKRRHSLGLVVWFFIKRTLVKFGWNRTLVLVVCFVPSNKFRLQTLVWLQLVVCEPIAFFTQVVNKIVVFPMRLYYRVVLITPSSWFKLVPVVFVFLLVYYLRKHLSFLKSEWFRGICNFFRLQWEFQWENSQKSFFGNKIC